MGGGGTEGGEKSLMGARQRKKNMGMREPSEETFVGL